MFTHQCNLTTDNTITASRIYTFFLWLTLHLLVIAVCEVTEENF